METEQGKSMRIHSQAVLASIAIILLLLTAQSVTGQVVQAEPEYTGDDRIEDWKDKTILVVTPHPDDETFTSGGTLALLAKNGNNVQIVIYTKDNSGSNDPTMTRERLEKIRRAEEEEACKILGIPAENITWLGHDDGMLEYVDRRELTKQVAREIRKHRPDAVFTIDPGAPYEQWHKSDHRSGAVITADALRASAWRLYFPELERQGFKHYSVPVVFFYYSAQPNYTVDITSVAEQKSKAAAAHVSQFGDMVTNYDETGIEQRKEQLAEQLRAADWFNATVIASSKSFAAAPDMEASHALVSFFFCRVRFCVCHLSLEERSGGKPGRGHADHSPKRWSTPMQHPPRPRPRPTLPQAGGSCFLAKSRRVLRGAGRKACLCIHLRIATRDSASIR